jgi:hypothetical protein
MRLVAEPEPEKSALVFQSNLLSRIADPPSLVIVAFSVAEVLPIFVAAVVITVGTVCVVELKAANTLKL